MLCQQVQTVDSWDGVEMVSEGNDVWMERVDVSREHDCHDKGIRTSNCCWVDV